MVIQIVFVSELGEFKSERMTMTMDQYLGLTEVTKNFYDGGFDMWMEDGFFVAPPSVVQRSLLIIRVIEND